MVFADNDGEVVETDTLMWADDYRCRSDSHWRCCPYAPCASAPQTPPRQVLLSQPLAALAIPAPSQPIPPEITVASAEAWMISMGICSTSAPSRGHICVEDISEHRN